MPKKKNYQLIQGRSNMFRDMFNDFFMNISSWPRLVLEVFIRRNMGERYFNLSSVLLVFVLLLVLPWIIESPLIRILARTYGKYREVPDYWSWYIFSGLFLIMGIIRSIETSRLSKIFEGPRIRLDTGEILPFFRKIKINNEEPSVETIETVLEPLFCFLVGMILNALGLPIGSLVMICSIIYSCSYFAAYGMGKEYEANLNDRLLVNEEELEAVAQVSQNIKTSGFNLVGERPVNTNRKEISGNQPEADDEFAEAL